jgi:hypothetical protein
MINYIPDQSIYKCVHELKCEHLDRIQEEIMNWVVDNTNFLEEKKETKFWHKIDFKNLARVCPNLLRFMSSVKIPIREITVGLLTETMTDGFVLHNGAPPYNFKINFPIYNTEDVWTEWFDIPQDHLNHLPTFVNPYAGTEQYNFAELHKTVQDRYPLLLRYNMHENPIIFNSYIPHRVMPGPDAKYPRIMIATMPMKDPVNLMLK